MTAFASALSVAPPRHRLLLVHSALLIAYLLPVMWFQHYPLSDFPGHVARQYLIYPPPEGANPYFTFEWQLVPTIGMDLFVQALRPLLGIEPASRLFVITSLATIYAGTVLLSYAINGRLTLVPALAALFLYNGAFMFGFIQYVSSIGVALVVYALWILLAARPMLLRIGVFSCLATLLYFFHLFGFGLYLLAVAGYETQRKVQDFYRAAGRMDPLWWKQSAQDLAVSTLQAAVPLVIFLANRSTSGAVDRTAPSGIMTKIEALVAVMFYAEPRTELPMLVALSGILLLGFVTRVIRIASSQYVVFALFAIAFLAMPRTLLASGYADYRMPSGVIFFFVASLSLTETRLPLARALAVATAILLAVRIALVLVKWSSYQAVLQEIDDVSAAVPLRSKVLIVEPGLGSISAERSPTISHHLQMLAGRRAAFVQYMFLGVNQTHIRVAPEISNLITISPPRSVPEDISPYDMLLVIRPDRIAMPPDFRGKPVASGTIYRLYDLRG